jgi:hypothetical protein
LCKKNFIYANRIENNGKHSNNSSGGIYVMWSRKIRIAFNNIQGNEEYGLKVEDSTVSATWNWWGSPLGPSRRKLGGDRIIKEGGRVRVFPWLPFKNPLAGTIEEQKYYDIIQKRPLLFRMYYLKLLGLPEP